MIPSLIDGLTERDMQAVVEEYTLTSFNWPTLFPLRYTPTFKWEQLIGEVGAPVAGDVISWDSRAPRKRREVVKGLTGEIVKIALAREKTESDMNEYRQLARHATDGARQRLLEWIWDDQAFVYTGVNAKLELLALNAASTGKASLTEVNNAGIVTENDVDFLIPAANKSGVPVPITVANAATSKPISKIKAIVKQARTKGRVLRYILTDPDTVDNILASDETLKLAAPFLLQATNLTATPSLTELNSALRKANLPIIGTIESFIQIEDKNNKNERVLVEPWQKGVMLFSETPTLGATFHSDLADEHVNSTTSLKVKRGHVLIKRYAIEEPLREVCLGMANAFPVLYNADKRYLVDTLNTSWNY